jgi:hypothetical protein
VRPTVIVVTIAVALGIAKIVVAVVRVVSPSRIVKHGHLRRIGETAIAPVVISLEKSGRHREAKVD